MAGRRQWAIPAAFVAATLVSLIAYGVIKAYHREPDLMLTVIVVRMAAAGGIGFAVAIFYGLAKSIVARSLTFRGFWAAFIVSSSIAAMGTVAVNLLQGS